MTFVEKTVLVPSAKGVLMFFILDANFLKKINYVYLLHNAIQYTRRSHLRA